MLRNFFSSGLLLLFTLVGLSSCNSAPQFPPRQPVTYMEVKEDTAQITSELPGRISAFHVSEVRPQVGGILKQRLFTEGSMVEAGQELYQIDPALYEAAYKSAQASLARAQAACNASKALAKRYSSLVKTKAVSQQEYDNALAQYKSDEAEVITAKANVDTALINLRYTKITAPITGRIGKSSVTEGALLTQNQVAPLATIQQLDKVYMDVSQSSYQVMNMQRKFGGKQKNDVQLIFQDRTFYDQKGSLEFYDITVDQSTDTVNVRITFPNPKGLLLPGMYARALITEGTDTHAVLIPQKVVTRDLKGNDTVKVLTPYVEKNSDGEPDPNSPPNLYTVSLRQIKSGGVIGTNKVYVVEGLQVGEIVLVDGQQKVGIGAIVQGTPATEETLYGAVSQHSNASGSEKNSAEKAD